MSGVRAFETQFTCDVSGRSTAMVVGISVSEGGGAHVELYFEYLPAVWIYSTEELSFVDAWRVMSWVSRIKWLHEATFNSVTRLLTDGCIGLQDRLNLARDLEVREDVLGFEIRKPPKLRLDSDTLQEILWRLPDSIRYGIGMEVVEAGWITKEEMTKLFDAPEVHLPIQPTLPPVIELPSSSGWLVTLRRAWPFGRIGQQHL